MTIEKARLIPAELLRQAYMDSGAFWEAGTLTMDGKTIPRDPLDMLLEGFAKDVQVMSGVTRDEGIFSTQVHRQDAIEKDVLEELASHFGSAC